MQEHIHLLAVTNPVELQLGVHGGCGLTMKTTRPHPPPPRAVSDLSPLHAVTVIWGAGWLSGLQQNGHRKQHFHFSEDQF